MFPLLFAGALAFSFFAMGCSKEENETLDNKLTSLLSFHPDTLKPFNPENPPKREFLNREDFRKDRFHEAVPRLYVELKAAGVEDAKIDRGALLFFGNKKSRRIGQKDKKLSPLELVMAAQEAHEDGLKTQGFQEVFQKFRKDPDLRLFYGKALLHSGRYQKAEKVFLQVVKGDTNTSLGISYLGDLFRLKGDYDNAERAYRVVLRKFPREFITQLHLGDMLRELKRYGAAEDVFLKLWEQKQKKEIVGRRLAELYKEIGEPTSAQEYLPKSSEH